MSDPVRDLPLHADVMTITDLTIHNSIIVTTMTDLTMRLPTETEFPSLQHPRPINRSPTMALGLLLVLISLLFEVVHHHQMPSCAPSVLASMEISSSAAPQPCGMEEQPDAFGLPMVQWSTRPEILSASIGTDRLDASDPIPAATSAQAVEAQPMEPSTVLMHRKSNAITPLHPQAWLAHLSASNLLNRYPTIYNGLSFGFNISIPPILNTFTPPNNSSIDLF
ncbi:hypothetical protein ARMGADRAFT_1073904 [Armillaria gallica]|uniref:Uncharacterized protein n=1 Tax=Armillaria gallica TaxID=47427 RepID=A0A2H3DYM8_ARMGA|nr:hypothetical protein ARMGADRAFT_1073904 [Armillaria gallica]